MNWTMLLVYFKEFSLVLLAVLVLMVVFDLIFRAYEIDKLQYEYNHKHFDHEEMKKKKVKKGK